MKTLEEQYGAAAAKINAKIDAARKKLEEAEFLSEKFGIPICGGLELSGGAACLNEKWDALPVSVLRACSLFDDNSLWD